MIMDNEPLVSVVLTTYNAKDYLLESISSVLSQTYKKIQFIIVDDCSNDNSFEYIKSSFNDDRMEAYRLDKNHGISGATNYGIKKVKGDYLAIIDSDDIWKPTKLQKQIEYLNIHPEKAACFTWVDIIDENSRIDNDKGSSYQTLFNAHTDTREEWLRYFFFNGNRLNNPSSIVSVQAMRIIGEHNIALVQSQDFDWWIRFTKKFSFGIIEEPLVKYRRFFDSTKHNNISNGSEIPSTRFYNEYMFIRYHFFDDMDNQLFIDAFEQDFVCRESRTDKELTCEKAFLLTKNYAGGSKNPTPFGVYKLFRMFTKPDYVKLLEEKYKFTYRDLSQLLGKHMYVDSYVQDSTELINEYKNEIDCKQKEIDMKEVHINNIESMLKEEQDHYHFIRKTRRKLRIVTSHK
jgi:glycosyltransferase involved in cell wall biosynthesis